jgi:exodeoxyribonuclease VIII
MIHCMIDLETLGVNNDAVFLIIAAVQFDLDSGKTGKIFRKNIKMQSALDAGLKVEAGIVQWWLEQRPEILKLMFQSSVDLLAALAELSYWFKENQIVYPWGNAASFDLGKLVHAYNVLHLSAPWKYNNERCYRTIKALFPSIALSDTHADLHDPVADCYYQIKHLCKIWGIVGNVPVDENPPNMRYLNTMVQWLRNKGYQYEIIGENFTATSYDSPKNP